MIKAILFDLDGVLIDSEKIKANAWKNVLEQYNVKEGDLWYLKFAGISRNLLCERAIKTFSLQTTIKELANKKKEEYELLIQTKTEPIEQALDFLKKIPKSKFKIGVVSSQNRNIIHYQLKKMNVFDYFDTIIAGEEDVTRNKPFSDIYILAALKLNLKPEECLAIEDSASGVESAVNAGIKCVAYKNQYTNNQDFSKASLVINDFSQLNLDDLVSLC